MKKQLWHGVVMLMMAHNASAAPSVYGKLDLSFDGVNADQQYNAYQINSNNSLIGIRGNEALDGGFSVLYVLEAQYYADGGNGIDKGNFDSRNAYLGLQHPRVGAIKFGKTDSYLKRLGEQDLFDNYAGNTVDITGSMTGETRLNNTFAYETPVWNLPQGSVQWAFLLAQGEDSFKNQQGRVSGTREGAQAAGNHAGDAWSTSLVYQHEGGLGLGLAADHGVPARWLALGTTVIPAVMSVNDPDTLVASNVVRGVARYDLPNSGVSLRALVQKAQIDDASTANVPPVAGAMAPAVAKFASMDNETAYALGVAYTVPQYPKVTLKGQYNHATTQFKQVYTDYQVDQYALGADYHFNRNTRGYVYFAQHNRQQAGSVDAESVASGFGLEYRF